MRKISSIILASLTILLVSCIPGRVYEKHEGIKELQWPKSEIKKFDFKIEDPTIKYDLEIAIRYVSACPYKKIPLNISCFQDEQEIFSVKHSVTIKNDDNTNIGSVMGNMWDITSTLKNEFIFEKSAEYRIEIKQISTYDPMLFVNEIGLIIDKSESE